MVVPWEPDILGIKDGLEQARVLKSGFKNEANYSTFIDTFVKQNFVDPKNLSAINFVLECVKLRRGAKLTDFLWFSPKSFSLVSHKVSNIIARYTLSPYKLFPAIIEDEKGRLIKGYNFFYMPPLDQNHILFSECKFEVGNKYDGYTDAIVNSPDDLFSFNDFLVARKVSLKNIEKDTDMFKVKLPIGILISNRLFQELHSANVTGIKFNTIKVNLEG